jgi:hypothetical protein
MLFLVVRKKIELLFLDRWIGIFPHNNNIKFNKMNTEIVMNNIENEKIETVEVVNTETVAPVKVKKYKKVSADGTVVRGITVLEDGTVVAPKKTKKSKKPLVFEEDEPEPTPAPVVVVVAPTTFVIADEVFSDEDGCMEVRDVVVPTEPTARKWVCGVCDRAGNYCDDECRHCRSELCRSCCNERSVDLDDAPEIEPCGVCGHYECQCDMERWRPDVSAVSVCGVCVGDLGEEEPEPLVCSCGEPIEDGRFDECEFCDQQRADNEYQDQQEEEQPEPTDEDAVSETEEMTHDGCPVCYEPTEHLTVDCGHKLCVDCHNTMTHGHNWNCPICRQRMVLGVRLPMTDAEKLADYDRMVAENRRLKAEVARLEPLARRNTQRAERVARVGGRRTRRANLVVDGDEPAVPVPRPARQPRVARAPRVPANHPEINLDEEDIVGVGVNPREYSGAVGVPSTVQVVLNDGEVLGDIEFGLRPRLKCCRQGCSRRTRRVCDGCRNIRVCEEHGKCATCMSAPVAEDDAEDEDN